MNVLLSIKPKYVKAILNGTKKYEFRKSAFRCKEDIEWVYIYATSQVKKIVGAFTIENIVEDYPKNLWAEFKEFSGIDEEEFFRYFGGHKKGFAIGIGDVEVFEDPIDPKSYNPGFVPPQSFRYIPEHWRFGK
jgi:type I restriction enzyme S subunit